MDGPVHHAHVEVARGDALPAHQAGLKIPSGCPEAATRQRVELAADRREIVC